VAEGLLRLPKLSPAIRFGHVLHGPFLATGAVLIASSLAYRRKKRPMLAAASPETAPARWHWRDLLLPPRAFLLAVLISIHGVADSALHIWMSRFLESGSFPHAPIAPGIVLSGYALSYVLARAALAALPDRVGRRMVLVLPGLLGGSILIVGILSRSYLLTAGGYVLGAFCWSVEYPGLVSTLMQNDRKRFGAAMAASGLMTGLALFASMNLMGLAVQRLGDGHMWRVMLVPPLGFLLVGIGGLAWLLRFDRPGTGRDGT
jgi:MFS family permease